MATTFVPLSLDLIQEGQFVLDINTDLQELQRKLIQYVNKHGDAATKAKGKLTIEILIGCANPEQEAYGIVTTITQSLPKRPPKASLAMSGEDQDGNLVLLVRNSGSDESNPEQGKLFKTHGEG